MWQPLLIAFLSFLFACMSAVAGSSLEKLPAISDNPTQLQESIQKIVNARKDLSAAQKSSLSSKLTRYAAFLGLSPDPESTTGPSPSKSDAEGEVSTLRDWVKRLMESSTQFLVCADFEDWSCLEKTPEFKPTEKWRQDTSSSLGQPVNAGPNLKMTTYYTQGWKTGARPTSGSVAEKLAELIQSRGGKSVSIALYGIDGIKASMQSVYESVTDRVGKPGLETRAVVDVSKNALTFLDRTEARLHPFIWTYLLPRTTAGTWIFGPNSPVDKLFDYDDSPAFINRMNQGIKSDSESRARLEWRPNGIMHNKFAVLGEPGKRVVWAGTANFSADCMGDEENANLSVVVDNDKIAGAYSDEFEEMFRFDTSKPFVHPKGLLMNGSGEKSIPMGRFHQLKSPNTHRYFTFDDGTEVRVHFSPTDDGEHRSLIPLLLSARKDDEIRISMFGSGGIEYVRALQYASAQGASVSIVLDKMLGAVPESWLTGTSANLRNLNPYVSSAKVQIKTSGWKGMNHHKSASLTRKLPNGKMRPEVLVVGSQNWSGNGNDLNDENMLTIRNRQKPEGLAAAVEFNQYFDQEIWKSSN